MSEWTSCLVNNGLAECGIGHRERFPVCRDQDDRIVEDMECEQVNWLCLKTFLQFTTRKLKAYLKWGSLHNLNSYLVLLAILTKCR